MSILSAIPLICRQLSRQNKFSSNIAICSSCGLQSYSTEFPTKRKYPKYYYEAQNEGKKRRHRALFALAGYVSISAACFYFIYWREQRRQKIEQEIEFNRIASIRRIYTAKEVARHPTWTTYNGGVYDFSKYAAEHPGGEETIAEAGGKALEPLWEKYKFHKDPKILEELETLRIGDLAEKDVNVARCKPVKNVPKVTAENYQLELTLGDEDSLIKSLSLEDVKSYPKYTLSSSIPCKNDPAKEERKDVPTWNGTRLIDIINDLGLPLNDYDKVQFECLDYDKTGISYRTNLPISKVKNPNFDILLAYEMNDTELTPEHGYPIRVVMPDLPGGRNVKWLSRIIFHKSKYANHNNQ